MIRLIGNDGKCRPSLRQHVRGRSIRGLPGSKENSMSGFGPNIKLVKDNRRIVTVIPYQSSTHKDTCFSRQQASTRRNSASPLKNTLRQTAQVDNRYDKLRAQRIKTSMNHASSQNAWGSFDNGNCQNSDIERIKRVWSVFRDQSSPNLAKYVSHSLVDQYKNLYAELSKEALKFRTAWEGYRFSILEALDSIQTHVMNLRSEFVASLDRAFVEPNEFIESTLKSIQTKCSKDSSASPRSNPIENPIACTPASIQATEVPNKPVRLPILRFESENVTALINNQLTRLCAINMEAYSFESIHSFNHAQRERLIRERKEMTEGSIKAKNSCPRTPKNQALLDHFKRERPECFKNTVCIPKDYRQAINMILMKQKSTGGKSLNDNSLKHTIDDNTAAYENDSDDIRLSDISTRPQTGPNIAVKFDDFEFRSINDIPETISLSVNLQSETIQISNESASNLASKDLLLGKLSHRNLNANNPRFCEVEEQAKPPKPSISRTVFTKKATESYQGVFVSGAESSKPKE